MTKGEDYIVISELPEFEQRRFLSWLEGMSVPIIDGEDVCAYKKDYEQWQRVLNGTLTAEDEIELKKEILKRLETSKNPDIFSDRAKIGVYDWQPIYAFQCIVRDKVTIEDSINYVAQMVRDLERERLL